MWGAGATPRTFGLLKAKLCFALLPRKRSSGYRLYLFLLHVPPFQIPTTTFCHRQKISRSQILKGIYIALSARRAYSFPCHSGTSVSEVIESFSVILEQGQRPPCASKALPCAATSLSEYRILFQIPTTTFYHRQKTPKKRAYNRLFFFFIAYLPLSFTLHQSHLPQSEHFLF